MRRLARPLLAAVMLGTAIVFVYDFHPLANTIMDLHLQPKPMAMRANGRMPQPPAPLNERVFWSYVAQLTSAIRSAHQAGLAVRTIDPTKILVTGKNRCVDSPRCFREGETQGGAQLAHQLLFDLRRHSL